MRADGHPAPNSLTGARRAASVVGMKTHRLFAFAAVVAVAFSLAADKPSSSDKYAKERAAREARQAAAKAKETGAVAADAKRVAETNRQQLAAVTAYLKDNLGEPESLQIIKATPIGRHIWAGPILDDDPDPPNNMTYDAVRVKFRAKNNVGAVQVFDKAVLLRAGKPVGIVRFGSEDLVNEAANDKFNRELFGK